MMPGVTCIAFVATDCASIKKTERRIRNREAVEHGPLAVIRSESTSYPLKFFRKKILRQDLHQYRQG